MTNQSFSEHRTLYRSRNGKIFGVCEGIARYADLSPFWVRLATIIAGALTSFVPIILIYIVAAIFIKPEPLIQPENIDDWEFYNNYTTNRKMALAGLKQKFDVLERRTRRLEDIVTKPEFAWDQKIRT